MNDNFFIYVSDIITHFNEYDLAERDKKLFEQRSNSKEFLLSRSMKLRMKKQGEFCISHKKYLQNGMHYIAVVGVGNKKFGLDLEVLQQRNFNNVVDFCFNDYEKKIFNLCDSNDKKTIVFYQIYTIKEAIIKACDLDFSYLSKVGLYIYKNKVVAKNHIGEHLIFRSYLLCGKFVVSLCFKE